MIRNVRRAIVLCVALAASGVALAAPAQADRLVASDVTPLSLNCRTIGDINPWTYLNVSCKRSLPLPREAYSAYLECWDVSARVSYSKYGDPFIAPWNDGYGPVSTARCDAGDYATDGGVHSS
jgi:hypothetical protein